MPRLYELHELFEGDLCVRAYGLDPSKLNYNLIFRKGCGAFLGPYNYDERNIHRTWAESCRFFKVEKKYSCEVKPTNFFLFVPKMSGPIEVKPENLWVMLANRKAMQLNNLDLGPEIKDLSGFERVIDLENIYTINVSLMFRPSAFLSAIG